MTKLEIKRCFDTKISDRVQEFSSRLITEDDPYKIIELLDNFKLEVEAVEVHYFYIDRIPLNHLDVLGI